MGLRQATDPELLAFAAREGRILLTHDVSTMPRHVNARLSRNECMPGVFEAPQGAPRGILIADLLLFAPCSVEHEWDGRIMYPHFSHMPQGNQPLG